jgi:DNA adenine methylase
MNKVKPIIKWAGGKTRIIHLIEDRIKLLETTDKTLFEPFAGGLSVSINLSKYFKYVRVSDVNDELINTYIQVKDNVENLIYILEKFKEEDSKEFFYSIRSSRNHEISNDYLFMSARFIYLNKTCFNGLYRINSKGHFNVPYGGYRKPNIVNRENFQGLSRMLNEKFIISKMDFLEIYDFVKKGDVVYLDPPYDPVTDSSFHTYQSGGFSRQRQIDLKKMIDKLTKKGVYVIMSNSITDFTLDTYKDYINESSFVEVKRLIGSKLESRKSTQELLIDNFNKIKEF